MVIKIKIRENLDVFMKFVHFLNILQNYRIKTLSADTQNQMNRNRIGAN